MGYETPESGWPRVLKRFAAEAWRRAAGTMTLPAWPTWSPAPPNGPLRAGIDVRRVAWVEQVKGSPLYTPEVIGAALRLLPTGTPFDPNTYQGIIVSAQAIAHERVNFAVRLAKGNINGGNLYLQRNGEAQPSFIRFFTERTFVDTTPLKVANVPEVRTYTYWPVIKDQQIGQLNQPMLVTVS